MDGSVPLVIAFKQVHSRRHTKTSHSHQYHGFFLYHNSLSDVNYGPLSNMFGKGYLQCTWPSMHY